MSDIDTETTDEAAAGAAAVQAIATGHEGSLGEQFQNYFRRVRSGEMGMLPALADMKAQLARLDLLVLDELGYVPTSKVGAELLFDVISTAYERSSVIVMVAWPIQVASCLALTSDAATKRKPAASASRTPARGISPPASMLRR